MPKTSFNPQWFSRPGDTIALLMAKRGLTSADLEVLTGWGPHVVKGLLLGSIPIDSRIADALALHIGGTPSFWRNRQSQFERQLDAVSMELDNAEAALWLRQLPVKQMREQGWLDASSSKVLRDALAFFDVASPAEWRDRYATFANEFRYRTSPTYESTIGALSAWLRQGERQAIVGSYLDWNPAAFRETLFKLRELTRSKRPATFIPKIQDLCAPCGVAIVFVRAPPGCRTSGASRFTSEGRAMMILSFRYLSDDHFWFTFFHEAAHLLLHGRGKTFVDGEVALQSTEEEEANAFAAGMLIPVDRFEEMAQLRNRTHDIMRFARSIGVSPGIVVGQMQHHKVLGPHEMNTLKRRFSWEEITSAAA